MRKVKRRTIEEALSEAESFNTLRELYREGRGLYLFLKRNKLLDHERLSHILIVGDVEQRKKLILLEIATKNLKYLDEIYNKKNNKVYSFILNNKLKPWLSQFLIDRGHPLTWSIEMVQEELKKYKSIAQIKKMKYSLYERALFYGLVRGKHKHRKRLHSPESVKIAISRCKSKQEFCLKYRAEYNYTLFHKIPVDLPDLNKNTSFGEEILRDFLERLFQSPFPKSRPLFMKNPNSRRSLELDGYCCELGIAFEHQGSHHFDKNAHWNRLSPQKYTLTTEHDRIKKVLCENNGVALLQIPDVFNLLKCEESVIKEELLIQFKRNNVKVPKEFRQLKFNFSIGLTR